MTVTTVAPAAAGVEVGSFFVWSWGYDQTNVNFYRVVGLTPKGVRIQEWSSATVDDNGPITHVVPGDGPRQVLVRRDFPQDELRECGKCRAMTESQFGPASVETYAARWCEEHGPSEQDSPVEVKRLSTYDRGDRINVYVAVGPYNDHAYAWDGAPRYETGSGWGH